MVVLALLTLSVQQDPGFSHQMLGIYATRSGVPIVVTSEHRANMLWKDQFVQFRGIVRQEDGSYKGEAVSGKWLLAAPVGHTADNLIGAAIDYVGDAAHGSAANVRTRNGSISLKLFSSSEPSGDGFQFLWTNLIGETELSEAATHAGELEDISIAGTYVDEAKDVSLNVERHSDGEDTDKLGGTITVKGAEYVFSGHRGMTHCTWVATDKAGKTVGDGFMEWAPTPKGIPAAGKDWAPTDRVYLLVGGASFGVAEPHAYFCGRSG